MDIFRRRQPRRQILSSNESLLLFQHFLSKFDHFVGTIKALTYSQLGTIFLEDFHKADSVSPKSKKIQCFSIEILILGIDFTVIVGRTAVIVDQNDDKKVQVQKPSQSQFCLLPMRKFF